LEIFLPLIEIVNSSTHRLNKGEYHLIIRKKGLSFRKAHSDDPYDTLLILTLKPRQINKVEFIEKRNGIHIVIHAEIPERLGELVKSEIELKSIEIPIAVLFEKLDLLFNETTDLSREFSENGKEEDIEEDPLVYFLKSFDSVFISSFKEGLQTGLSFVKSGLSNIQKTLKKGIESLNKLNLPLLQTKQEIQTQEEIVEFKESYISLNKVTHCYIDALKEEFTTNNEEKKNVLLFLHGLGFNHKIWDSYLTKFYLKGYRVISYDLRGHGKSQRPEKLKNCQYRQLQEDFDEFIKKTNLDNRNVNLILVTFSTTGMILTRHLEKNCPKSLTKIVLLSSSDHISKELSKVFRRIPVPEVWLPLKEQAVERAKEMLFTNPRAQYVDKILEIPQLSDANVLSEAFRSLGEKKFENRVKYKKLKDIELLAIVGTNDPIFPPESISKLKESMTNTVLKAIDGANHFFPFEEDDYINFTINEIADFIDHRAEFQN
jgi:pimeloyl-ACP methyl ester carboxylesterase